MPKIIENLENKLIEEARKQLDSQGYAAVTIRSVAAACGVGVGTVYNYFPSKDALLAAYILQDWNNRIHAVGAIIADAQTPECVLRCIYNQLRSFTDKFQHIICDPEAREGFAPSYSRYHGLLRGQLAMPIRKFCESDFAAEFAAEAMLTWAMSGKSFEEIYEILGRVF